ncbi:hypothetical protein UFOVP291_34 [uncultured Caudovirales phage]|uniref:Uncharacterized protein n=1 Tax=uncultured Caudovirales phage TaxID=2100421 RepID=A0A6J5LRE4_9CAUD|nr:hypothetical protein UFOVP291_34 [uncultured Caudovirales phage]
MQAAGAAKSRRAMEAAANAERQRQQAYQRDADALFAESLSKQGAEQQIKGTADAEAARLAATQGAQQQTAAVNIPTQGATPTVVSDETSARVGTGNAQAAQDAANRAALASFGDVQLGNALMNTRYGQKQGQIGRNMQGSANVLALETEAASHRGDSLKGIGSLLNAGGQIAGLGAGMGWGAPTPPVPMASTMGQITASSVLPTTNGITTFGADPSWFQLGNPNNWAQKLGVRRVGF